MLSLRIRIGYDRPSQGLGTVYHGLQSRQLTVAYGVQFALNLSGR
jgi:hypothetical protein